MKYWSDAHRTLYNGNCRSMSELADNSIQCCVTSPPYWGLRKYAGEQDSIWGRTPECLHEWGDKITPPNSKSGKHQGILGGVNDAQDSVRFEGNLGCWCSLCGAWRGAYGLEPSPQMYVQHTVEILREIRRVLRKDGVVFWNVDDSYSSFKDCKSVPDSLRNGDGTSIEKGESVSRNTKTLKASGLKNKDLCLIPFRVAIAAQEDGWYVRSVIIWSKPNPMPESVTDRPTGSHEYILMLTKSPKYFWDMEAVREKYQSEPHEYSAGKLNSIGCTSRSKGDESEFYGNNGRNLRNVWTFPTQPYREAHFATFPEALPEKCIKAATPEVGCCSKCGIPWERIVEHKNMEINRTEWGDKAGNRTASSGTMVSPPETKTLGWQPGCKCNADKVPSTVLDPFCGSGTTLEVAAKLNRHAVGYEISEEYCKLIVTRNNQSCLL